MICSGIRLEGYNSGIRGVRISDILGDVAATLANYVSYSLNS